MKKLFIAVTLFAMTSVAANAQDWFLGGSIIANHTKVSDTKLTIISVVPSINKIVSEKFALGLGIGYSHIELSVDDTETIKLQAVRIQPTFMYIKKITDRFYYNPELQVGLGFGVGDSEFTHVGVGIAPLSFEFRPTPKLGIGASAGFLGFDYLKPEYGEKLQSFTLQANADVSLKFRYYF